MDTPAPEPPPKRSFTFLLGRSEPPEANPKETFDIGIMAVPSWS